MLQAVQANSICPLPLATGYDAKPSRAFPAGHSADIIDLHDYFVPPAAKTLTEAKERILQELPPKPDFTGMGELQAMAAMYEYTRLRLYAYETVLFG